MPEMSPNTMRVGFPKYADSEPLLTVEVAVNAVDMATGYPRMRSGIPFGTFAYWKIG